MTSSSSSNLLCFPPWSAEITKERLVLLEPASIGKVTVADLQRMPIYGSRHNLIKKESLPEVLNWAIINAHNRLMVSDEDYDTILVPPNPTLRVGLRSITSQAVPWFDMCTDLIGRGFKVYFYDKALSHTRCCHCYFENQIPCRQSATSLPCEHHTDNQFYYIVEWTYRPTVVSNTTPSAQASTPIVTDIVAPEKVSSSALSVETGPKVALSAEKTPPSNGGSGGVVHLESDGTATIANNHAPNGPADNEPSCATDASRDDNSLGMIGTIGVAMNAMGEQVSVTPITPDPKDATSAENMMVSGKIYTEFEVFQEIVDCLSVNDSLNGQKWCNILKAYRRSV